MHGKLHSMVIEPEREVRHFREGRTSEPSPVDPTLGQFFPNVAALSLPEDLQNELHRFQIAEYARQFFRERRAGKIFGRKKVSIDNLAAYQADALGEPLLDGIAKTAVRPAIDCFKHILAYTGADGSTKQLGQPIVANKIVSHLMTLPELRDEVFFQLVKQTRQNPNQEVLQRTWELFLIIATLFPSSRNSEVWIKAHLLASSKGETPVIAELAQFTYIRFNVRCQIGKPLPAPSMTMFKTFIQDRLSGHASFGASLYEQLWNQRLTHPKMPIPHLVHEMAEALIEKGAERSEGIFRLSGNLKKVKQMEQTINEGGDPVRSADLNDVASLFKSWFASLPESLVTDSHLGALQTAFETHTHLDFVKTLPHAHIYSLKYLIGFLKRLVPAEPITKMTPKNFAIVFAPNIVYSGSITDPAMLTKQGEVAQDLIITLIADWDVTDVYPPPESFFQDAK